MTRQHDEDDFDTAWQAFAREDAAIVAPPELEARVLAAVQKPPLRRAPRTLSRWALAAAAMVVGVLSWSNFGRAPISVGDEPGEDIQVLAPGTMSLGAAPLHDTELLQLVRLRLPRESLRGLGIALLEPDAQALIDVDVLIGEDGLPREIRQVRADRP